MTSHMDFYAEFRKLVLAQPRSAVTARAAENCTYGDYLFRSKNTYLGYYFQEVEDSYYSEHLYKCRDCVDSAYLSACELCYQCLDCSGLYNCNFLQDCHNCSECYFCFDCLNSKNCFGSFGLRQQQFCIFNKPYPEDEYYRKLAMLKKNPPAKVLKILQPEFDRHPRLFARMLKGGENSFGDYIYFSKNCFQCYNVRNVHGGAYISEIMNPEAESADCIDCTFCGELELCYECDNVTMANNCNFLLNCSGCSDCEYSVNCYNCRNCFGCAYIENKDYCILNRQFTRGEYLLAVAKIKEELKTAGAYGKPLAEILI